MHVLLCNDDGIQSDHLRELSRAFVAAGHQVTVVAPSCQRSAAGHCLSVFRPTRVKKVDWENGDAYAVDGMPADCADVGLLGVARDQIDMVVSGINQGLNMGMAVYCSGTVGAASEATLLGFPAIAASVSAYASIETVRYTAITAVKLAERLLKTGLPPLTLLNLNVPKDGEKTGLPMKLCPVSGEGYTGQLKAEKTGENEWIYQSDSVNEGRELPRGWEAFTPGSDVDFLQKGYTTCTFIGHNPGNMGEIPDIMQD